ncbi:MAG: DUF6351 family protein [Marinobacter sp.]|uniref:DUF6351 family protein n=1 Tax=Marinobacter sp. TaxID=50741 RepID=UPI00299EB6DE|nr:DUF6351 family protein [Marinobacter sp.]MDX1756169.1 DUF6351 family protein [Marinobacter sp.]
MLQMRNAVALGLALSLAACGGSDSSSSPDPVVAGVNENAPEQTPPASPPGRQPKPDPEPEPLAGEGVIRVLSNRADLISGGDALIEIEPDNPANLQGATVWLGDREVTQQFQATGQNTLKGLLSGLALGDNELRVWLADNSYLLTTITNHPNGGPVFSGPQVQPWNCTNAQAVDDQCNQPPDYRFKYVPADKLQTYLASYDPDNVQPGLPDAFYPYDPENPPAEEDIAVVTTDEGHEVPFIVRVETGVQNRDRYQIMALYQPGQEWNALAPQEQWNGKVLVHHGGNVGVSYGMGHPPNGDISGTAPDGGELLLGDSITVALSRGFMTLSTAQANLGHNVNLVTAAESLMMAKERIVEQYGEIRYTIGTGCSGGAIAQQHIANAYPGIYQGLILQCSYPDVWTTATQFADYHLLNHHFGAEAPESADGFFEPMISLFESGLLPVQWPAFYGHLPVNPQVSDAAFFPSAYPDQADCPGLAGGAEVYDADTRPDGLRCGLLDYMISQFGPRAVENWSPNEQLLARGFGGIPLDNVGVQYGLRSLQNGVITGDQFLTANREIGGLNVDIDFQETRTVADPQALSNAYRTGAINTAEHLGNVAIMDLRGPDPGIAHDAYHSWQMRARLEATQGHVDNHVIWYGAAPLFGDTVYSTEALVVMDRWLANIEGDETASPVEAKVLAHKPPQARDRCLQTSSLFNPDGPIIPMTGNLLYPDPIIPGLDPTLLPPPPAESGLIVDAVSRQVCGLDLTALNEAGVPTELTAPLEAAVVDQQALIVQSRFGTPRTLAGDDIRTLTNKCRLRPVDPADYESPTVADPEAFAEEVAAIFPEGVCDYSQTPAGTLPTETWLHYGSADEVVYGGGPLPQDVPSSRQGWASPAFGLSF